MSDFDELKNGWSERERIQKEKEFNKIIQELYDRIHSLEKGIVGIVLVLFIFFIIGYYKLVL